MSQGTLFVLTAATFVLNYTHSSPFKHLIPPLSYILENPIDYFRTWVRVIMLHEKDRNEKVIAKHTGVTDDVAKRHYFRKAHGLDKENPIANFLGASGREDEEAAAATTQGGAADVALPLQEEEGQKKKKWFGVF